MFHRTLCIAAALCAGLAALCGCSEFDEDTLSPDYAEGRPATVRIQLLSNDMQVRSRAEMLGNADRRIDDIWIGVYDETTKKLKSSYYTSFSQEIPDSHDPRTVSFETTSGRSRIVGVANVEDNVGAADWYEHEVYERVSLHKLLDKADTWEKYTQIAETLLDSTSISKVQNSNLVMSGAYYERKTSDPVNWGEEELCGSVSIPAGEVTLPGAIHLRRLVSYVKFTLKPGGSADREISVKLDKWAVHYHPIVCYLHDQDANAADEMTTIVSMLENKRNSYGTSEWQTAQTVETDGISFDFYQFENKHIGLDVDAQAENPYYEREREYKTGEGLNTGIYKSLVDADTYEKWKNGDRGEGPLDSPALMNNCASFVEIHATVTRMDKESGKTMVGNVVYTIHLGYCEKSDPYTDFTVRRNVKYNYTVVIEDLDAIRVEAVSDEENQPGAEGDLTDVEQTVFDCDSHYCTFNIQLTDEERSGFNYLIHAPYGDETVVLSRAGVAEDGLAESDRQFYDWIRFRPARSKNDLAFYTGVDEGNVAESLWSLDDMRDVAGHPNTYGSGWYTVFINEYVYEKDREGNDVRYDGDGIEVNADWKNYVNKNARVVWLMCSDEPQVSSDRESSYIGAKYLVKQQSIWTYYAVGNADVRLALGIETENESYGLGGIRWTWKNTSNLSSTNGRWNMWNYLEGKTWADIAETQSYSDNTGDSRTAVPMIVPAITNKMHAGRPAYEDTYVFMPKSLSLSGNYGPQEWDPQGTASKLYEAMTLCMTRNRDLNGNGRIDENEIRWYLPAAATYTRMVLGEVSLPYEAYFMDWSWGENKTTEAGVPYVDLPYGTLWRKSWSENNEQNARFHYASSDRKTVWMEEGMSLGNGIYGPVSQGYDKTGAQFCNWNLRCVRSLGVNLRTPEEAERIRPAFEAVGNNTVSMTYYEVAALRGPTNGTVPVHTINSEANKVYRRFQYAKEALVVNVTSSSAWKKMLDPDDPGYNDPCAAYSEENDPYSDYKWRVPVQKENSIMLLLGILDSKGIFLSCTQEYYGSGGRFSGCDTSDGITFLVGDEAGNYNYNKTIYVRCVRDAVWQ